ncbi:MAG: hypothetical protein GWN16_13230 [Calditrichae bacterium]|nr:hypothetical protein [Calditrichia bacterium]NIW80350.1 hypothetical protein [Calditrichia bacterium]
MGSGGFIGDTRRGGSCNVEEYRLIPHCNGTHTECVGHISDERVSLQHIFKNCLIPATLTTVRPENAQNTKDSYVPDKQNEDDLITRNILQQALQTKPPAFLRGLIIRTLPNEASKTTRIYTQNPPPFFSLEAMKFIDQLNVQHLLVDIPSLDRTFDEGMLNAHRIFWNIPRESNKIGDHTHLHKTITEMIYVPDKIADGQYLVNIQIPDIVADAAPSRIFLFKPILK